ncbi:hypothetical protein D8I30_08880 [Brevundimonas naejangsanensis]|uniref:Uncharacterized protein n=1 Tax=Brevundimonas naejangsanensis TaxID=588932 RepID=A0A494RIS5_9CAUL|nr:hypothetical protein D8I30_08880 [Brevundimonas naejangsanensis]
MKGGDASKPRSGGLSRSSSPKGGSALQARSSSPKDDSATRKKPSLSPWEQQKEAAKRSALNALKRARRSAEKAGVSLSGWEGEFLDSVDERIREHGRAFADPEKGAPGQALSSLQGRKLKEITAKAKGEETRPWMRKAKAKE